jgi:Domain of unknown function (DUF5671)
MDNKPKTTAKDFFLYLAIAIGLYVSVVSFLTLVFAIIDKVLPLAGEYATGPDGTIRMSVAALIIFFPTFFYLTWLVFKDLQIHPEKREIWVRRWMIFFTLFVAGLTMAIDLATLIYRFLGAEDLTLRFFLKIFFVFSAAITIFFFYLYSLKRSIFEYKKSMNIRLAFISAIVVGSIAYGIMLIGSPAQQRKEILDAQRINDLASIQSQIVYTQWENKGTVPDSLSALNDPISGFTVPTDPETKAPYEYTKLSKNSFELCATFETVASTSTAETNVPVPALYPDSTTNENWQHGIGNVCFTRTIDPSLYKVSPATK